jgi:N-acetyltransferase
VHPADGRAAHVEGQGSVDLTAYSSDVSDGVRNDRAVTSNAPQSSSLLKPLTLTGRYVQLEPLAPEHAEPLAKAATQNRTSYGLIRVPDGVDQAQAYIEVSLARQATGRELPFAVRRLADEQVVGSTRFLDLDVFTWPAPSPAVSGTGPLPGENTPPTVAEIGGTWYSASAQRTAVNTECKLLLLAHAFEVWAAIRVSLKTDARNQASRRAIERIGAQFEGIRRAHVPATDGTIRDSAYFSIIQSEWPPIRAALTARLAT